MTRLQRRDDHDPPSFDCCLRRPAAGRERARLGAEQVRWPQWKGGVSGRALRGGAGEPARLQTDRANCPNRAYRAAAGQSPRHARPMHRPGLPTRLVNEHPTLRNWRRWFAWERCASAMRRLPYPGTSLKKGWFMTSRYKQAKTVQPELVEGRHLNDAPWIPAFAGMTKFFACPVPGCKSAARAALQPSLPQAGEGSREVFAAASLRAVECAYLFQQSARDSEPPLTPRWPVFVNV